jgi:LysM repeat protein
MNNQSPLIPQGSALEQKNKGRARVKIAVFFVLAVHGIGLLALLVQGCRNDTTKTAQAENTNAPAPPPFEPTNATAVAIDTNTPIPGAGANSALPTDTATANLNGADYSIAPGDNFTGIAKKFRVTVKAITDANPGVEPTRLRLGQKIHIPAPSTTAPSQPATAVAASNGTGDQMYVVKSGDTLSTIAHQHTTTVRATRTANSLTTDRITVGQKLKLPKGSVAGAAEPVTTASNSNPQAH